jgi:hypothetical protein
MLDMEVRAELERCLLECDLHNVNAFSVSFYIYFVEMKTESECKKMRDTHSHNLQMLLRTVEQQLPEGRLGAFRKFFSGKEFCCALSAFKLEIEVAVSSLNETSLKRSTAAFGAARDQCVAKLLPVYTEFHKKFTDMAEDICGKEED